MKVLKIPFWYLLVAVFVLAAACSTADDAARTIPRIPREAPANLPVPKPVFPAPAVPRVPRIPRLPMPPGVPVPGASLEYSLTQKLVDFVYGNDGEKLVKRAVCVTLNQYNKATGDVDQWERRITANVVMPSNNSTEASGRILRASVDKAVEQVATKLAGLTAEGQTRVYARSCLP
jgi:hypothetical protein